MCNRRVGRVTAAVALLATLTPACHRDMPASGPVAPTPTTPGAPASSPPVYIVLFTHIEDHTPAGTIGTPANRTSYLNLRARLLEMAAA